MPTLVLDLLKYVLLAVLYIFVWRAVKAVYLELRPPGSRRAAPASSPPVPPRRARKAPRKLVVVEGPHKGRSFELGDELTIGRSDRAHVVLDDNYVSQLHARIYTTGDGYVIEDLGSTNGTYLNRHRITHPAELHRGDRIKIGKTVLEARR